MKGSVVSHLNLVLRKINLIVGNIQNARLMMLIIKNNSIKLKLVNLNNKIKNIKINNISFMVTF